MDANVVIIKQTYKSNHIDNYKSSSHLFSQKKDELKVFFISRNKISSFIRLPRY